MWQVLGIHHLGALAWPLLIVQVWLIVPLLVGLNLALSFLWPDWIWISAVGGCEIADHLGPVLVRDWNLHALVMVSGQKVVILLHFNLLRFEQILCRVGAHLRSLQSLVEFWFLISEFRVIAITACGSCEGLSSEKTGARNSALALWTSSGGVWHRGRWDDLLLLGKLPELLGLEHEVLLLHMADSLRVFLLDTTGSSPTLRSLSDQLSFGSLLENLRLVSRRSSGHGLDVALGALMLQTHFLLIICHLYQALLLKEV
jgi:hypothetical protein